MSFGGGGAGAPLPPPPAPVYAQESPPREEVFTEVSDFDLSSIGHTRIGPDQFASYTGGTRSGAEVLDLLSFRPKIRSGERRGAGGDLERLEAAQLQEANNRRSRGLPPKDLRPKKRKTTTSPTVGPLGIVDPAPARAATLLGG